MSRPLTELQVAQIKRMRADGHTAKEAAEAVGCARATAAYLAPGRPGKVSNDRLRAAFLASHRSAADVARALGWNSGHGADTSRVRRTLGVIPEGRPARDGQRPRRRLIDWETGSLIAEAIGVAPWEVLDDDFEDAA